MLNSMDIQHKLDCLIQYLAELDVEVTLFDAETEKGSIAQLRNQRIVVNTRARDGLSCIFTIAHLFGHLVQRLSYEKYAHLIIRVGAPKPISVDKHFRRAFYQYEVGAFQLGKGLLLACFEMPCEMDSKYTLFMQTDFAHFWHYITTGERGDIATFNDMLARAFLEWEGNKEVLSPLPHPRPIRIERPAMIDVV